MGRYNTYIYINTLYTCLNLDIDVHQVSARRVRANFAKLRNGNWQNKLGPIMGVDESSPPKKQSACVTVVL